MNLVGNECILNFESTFACRERDQPSSTILLVPSSLLGSHQRLPSVHHLARVRCFPRALHLSLHRAPFPFALDHRGPSKDRSWHCPNTVHERRVSIRSDLENSFVVAEVEICARDTMESDRPDTFSFRVGTATFTSLLAGSLVGALTATWKVRRRVCRMRRRGGRRVKDVQR